MANLTLSIDGETLKRARLKATEQGTSVNSLVREYLAQFAGEGRLERQREVTQKLLELADRTDVGSGKGGRAWTREDLYQERLSRYGDPKSRSSSTRT